MALDVVTLTVALGEQFSDTVDLAGRRVVGMITDAFLPWASTVGFQSQIDLDAWVTMRVAIPNGYSTHEPKLEIAAQANQRYIFSDQIWRAMADVIRIQCYAPDHALTFKMLLED